MSPTQETIAAEQEPTTTYARLVRTYGLMLSYEQLANYLQRTPDGLRVTLAQNKDDWYQRLNGARVRFGRRVLFDAAVVAKVIDERRGQP